MITDMDITKLKGVFALQADMQHGFREVGERFDQMDEKVDTIASAVGRIENTIDGLAGAIQDLRTENGAGTAHLLRHDRQIEALAVATKITLSH